MIAKRENYKIGCIVDVDLIWKHRFLLPLESGVLCVSRSRYKAFKNYKSEDSRNLAAKILSCLYVISSHRQYLF